jgi:hypothetical protein
MDATETKAEEIIRARAAKLRLWLLKYGQGADARQAHLEPGSVERIYWHYGYQSALQDVERLLTGEIDRLE